MLNLPRQASLAWTTVGGRLIFLPFPKDPISFFATLWHHQVDHSPYMSDLDFMLLFLDQVERWEPDCSSAHCGSGNKQTALCLGFKAKFISIRLVLLWHWYLPVNTRRHVGDELEANLKQLFLLHECEFGLWTSSHICFTVAFKLWWYLL